MLHNNHSVGSLASSANTVAQASNFNVGRHAYITDTVDEYDCKRPQLEAEDSVRSPKINVSTSASTGVRGAPFDVVDCEVVEFVEEGDFRLECASIWPELFPADVLGGAGENYVGL